MAWYWIVSIILGSIIVLRILVYYLQVNLEVKCGLSIKMNYDNFVSLYRIAPYRYQMFNFQERGPCLRYEDDELKEGRLYIYFNTCRDWLKVKWFMHKMENDKVNSKILDCTNEYIRVVQKDLDIFSDTCKADLKKYDAGYMFDDKYKNNEFIMQHLKEMVNNG